MSRIASLDRIEYEYEHRPPRRTEHEQGKKHERRGGSRGRKVSFFSDDSLERYNFRAFQEFRPRATE